MSMPTDRYRPAGLGDNPHVFEETLLASEGKGYPEDSIIHLRDWMSTNGAALGTTVGATPYINFGIANLPTIAWIYTSTTTDVIRTAFQVPGQYDPNIDQLYFLATMQKNDTSDENADLAMNLMVRQFMPGMVNPELAAATVPSGAHLVAGENTLTAFDAAISRTLAAPGTSLNKFYTYQYDLGSDKRGTLTDALRIKPLDILVFEFGPSEQVGTTDMLVLLAATSIRMIRNASLAHRNRRFRLDGSLLLPNGPSTSTTEQYIR